MSDDVATGPAAALALRQPVCASYYEQRPSVVHEPESLLRDLLVFIRSARSLCKTLGGREDALRELEDRAEALRRPLH